LSSTMMREIGPMTFASSCSITEKRCVLFLRPSMRCSYIRHVTCMGTRSLQPNSFP
jgi:hypothetical protein